MPKPKKVKSISEKKKDTLQKAIAISFIIGLILGVILESGVAFAFAIGLGIGFFVGKIAERY